MSRDPIGERGGLNLYGFVGNNPVIGIDPYGLINITKTKVGAINISRGITAGMEGTAHALIAVVAFGSGVGWPFGVFETGLALYSLTIKFPGLTMRGLQQIEEGLNECPGKISFGHWKNLRGLGPLGTDVDDPGETYSGALKKKRDKAKEISKKMLTSPGEALKDLWIWIVEWAI